MRLEHQLAVCLALVAGAELSLQAAQPDAQRPRVQRAIKLTNIETSYPHWSPDGTRLVYQSNRTGNSEIYIMNADGTGAVRLTDHPAVDENPAWSPDGTRIAFRSYRDGNAEIYSMAIDGSDLRNLTRHPADDIHPYWSPDGSRILFNSNRRVDAAGRPVLTIFSMRADGSDVRPISREVIEDTYAQYSPDGSQIVFRRRLDEETPGWERNPGNSDIFVMAADGTNARRLTSHPGFDGWPSWSPDGRWIAFGAEGAGEFQIALVRPDGTGLVTLTEGPGAFTKPIYSPDGRRIVCTRTLDGNVEVFILELTHEASNAGPSSGARPSAAARLVERALDAMGGRSVIAQLPVLTTGYHMLERSLGQEEWPGGPAATSVQIGRREFDPAQTRERLTMQRHMSGGRVYTRVLDAGAWATLARQDLTTEQGISAALAAVHPESLLVGLPREDIERSSAGGRATIAGRPVVTMQTRLHGRAVALQFDDLQGHLRAVEWASPNPGAANSRIRAVFSQYRPAVRLAGTPRLPHLVEVWKDDELLQVRTYDEYGPGESLAALPVRQANPEPPLEVELAPYVFQLRGSDYTSLVVDVGERVVVVELPESLERGRAVLEVARRHAAGRPISVVVTHIHEDHVAGLSAAAGVQVIAHERSVDRVRSLLTNARPGDAPDIVGVATVLRMGAEDRALELRAVRHSHAEAMLVAYVPGHRLLFEADLIRGLLPHSTAELVEWVTSSALDVHTVASSHGSAQPWAKVTEAVRAWRARLGVD
jgi:TolB protein